MLIATIMSPGSASGTDTRLQGDGAIVARATGDVAPYDPVAAFDRPAKNVGALAGDVFDVPARLVAGNDRQGVTIAQRPVPAVHVRTAECRGRDLNQQGSGVELRA